MLGDTCDVLQECLILLSESRKVTHYGQRKGDYP